MADEKPKCFIIMPITTPDFMLDKYRDGAEHFIHVLNWLFIPSAETAGYEPISSIAEGADFIHAEIIDNLDTADLVLCDMSCLNPNVFFEFGIRTSLNKPVCVVKDELTTKVPFDTGVLNYEPYRSTLEMWEIEEQKQKLTQHLKTSAEKSDGQNTLWKRLGLKKTAAPYEFPTGDEGLRDYLATQFDSLHQKLTSSKTEKPSRPPSLRSLRISKELDRAELSLKDNDVLGAKRYLEIVEKELHPGMFADEVDSIDMKRLLRRYSHLLNEIIKAVDDERT